ncbi:MAG: ABC transporter ATP-binding protein [Deltaproteobacteria bacterium]|nr:ABC transporter ATP-binding protein [Deltaproteobacteria bacterium]MBI3077030.1 ABC transporter ATP-binding protein [Deltaproteobacteria bacterium]
MTPRLQVRGLRKWFYSQRSERRLQVFDEITLEVLPSEFLTIVGPSGCGKTTLLRVLDGLIPYEEGEILLDGHSVVKPGADKGFVFQDSSLLPWRTVMDNVILGLELQRIPRRDARQRALQHIELVGLKGFEDHYPYELSGGMQQRVNLARALVVDPAILLMDEPFASLDAQTREIMQAELLKLWAQDRKTVLFVTHQIEEAIFLADRVAVLTARPSRVREVVEIKLPRPRRLEMKRTPEFLDHADHIWRMIQEEVYRTMARTGHDRD